MKLRSTSADRATRVGSRVVGPQPSKRIPFVLAGGLVLLAGAAMAQAPGPESAAASAGSWPVVGRQGVIQIVIVPLEQAANRAAYDREIASICAPGATCFINFFTNSTGTTAALPLPDAISAEATAMFRRSIKQGGEFFRWSCRLRLPEADCF